MANKPSSPAAIPSLKTPFYPKEVLSHIDSFFEEYCALGEEAIERIDACVQLTKLASTKREFVEESKAYKELSMVLRRWQYSCERFYPVILQTPRYSGAFADFVPKKMESLVKEIRDIIDCLHDIASDISEKSAKCSERGVLFWKKSPSPDAQERREMTLGLRRVRLKGLQERTDSLIPIDEQCFPSQISPILKNAITHWLKS